ncbi:hypothetical protein BCR36DRAFT_333654 [Piromyces finnis]|uniref:CRCB-domain-containing protein n=1 Tax=Piromyces finnis TaxID=1754191 RepID=A0A1Y1V1F4_9FUNG|nr:hypothetical protein BCR36DRAFT_333654 [Piromyces finnis]|eukprot:ORX44977.1 hypothetical protein BCR36DRAFT_333654 [Piromyces finnis]
MEENIYHIYLSIALFAIIGVLIRIELNKIESELFIHLPFILPNSIGCILLGLVNAFKNTISGWQYAVYLGLTTGLCGSITTFSSWNMAVFKDIFNLPHFTSYSYRNICSGLLEIIVSLTAYTALIKFGYHIGKFLPFSNKEEVPTTIKREKPKMSTKFFIYAGITAGLLILTLVLTIVDGDIRKVWLSCLLAPFGALIRYFLSSKNKMFQNFPFGTFIANIMGTLCLAVFNILRYSLNHHEFLCHFITAVGDGFCGCLTTISTFANELNALKTKSLYAYCITSIVAAQFVILGTFGFYGWSSNLNNGMSC